MIIDESTYLAHYGRKGMKWGVRKRRGGTAEQRRQGNKKFARNLALGTAAGVAGGLAVGAMLKRHQSVKVSQLRQIQTSKENIQRMTKAFAGNQAKVAKGADFLRSRADAFKAIPMGPIGSTGVARLGGAIPMPR